MTGGPCGFVGIPMLGLGSFVLDTDLEYYLLVWLVVIRIIAFLINATNSRVGRALQALKWSEDSAATMGVPAVR